MVQEKISNVTKDILDIYDNEKNAVKPSKEEVIDELLDGINRAKKYLNDQSERLEKIVPSIHELTWITDFETSDVDLLKELVLTCKGLHSDLAKNYVKLNKLGYLNIARNELRKYKTQIDDFKEAYTDVDSRFFVLPNLQDFKDAEKLLSNK